MTTLEEAVANSRLWEQLVRRYPELRHSPMPAIDAMVVEFLRQHDVFVKPVGSNVNASPGMNAMMGAVGGPMAVGVSQALTAQSKGIALQEWTSWKQWALSHSDWALFTSNIENKYQADINRAIERIGAPEVQEFIDQYQRRALQNSNKIAFAWTLGLSAFLAFIAFGISNKQNAGPVTPPVVEESEVSSDTAEQCRQKVIASGAGADHQYFAGVKADTNQFAKLVFEKPGATRWEASYPCE